MAQRLCDSVAGSATYILERQSQMQVEVLRNLLADLAGKGGRFTESLRIHLQILAYPPAPLSGR